MFAIQQVAKLRQRRRETTPNRPCAAPRYKLATDRQRRSPPIASIVVFSCSNATGLEHGSKHKKRCTLPSERRGVLKWQLGFYQSISRLPLSSSMDRCMDNNDQLRGVQARLHSSRNTSNTDHRLRVYGVYSITFATRLLIPVRLQLDSAVAWCANHTRCHSLLPFLASMEGEFFQCVCATYCSLHACAYAGPNYR